jgi:dipeptidyl aminopeptidase/acylaminoacyl peptidase
MKITVPLARPITLLLVAAGLGLNLPIAAAQVATAPAKLLPAEAFFKKPAIGSPTLSPSGKKIAMLVPTQSGRIGLAVADIATPDKFVGVAQFGDADVRSVSWVNDERLVFDATDRQAPKGEQFGTGLYAVDADGSDFLWLIERTGNFKVVGNPVRRPLPSRYQYARPLLDGSDDVLISRMIPGAQGVWSTVMMRLNTRNMATRSLYTGSLPAGVQSWVLDQDLDVRAVVTTDGKREMAVHWREKGSPGWTELYKIDVVEDVNATMPLAVDRDGQLYVRALNTESKDGTTGLFRYDVKQRKVEAKPLVTLPGFDFDGDLRFDPYTKQLLGVSYAQETGGMLWFDKNVRGLQEAVDKLLPSTNNYLSCSRCVDGKHVVVMATSDIQAPVYFLFDRETSKLTLLGASRPWLNSTAMVGTQDFTRVKVRDGMEIPVYVTKPKGKGPWPTVVMVHGGPYVRGVEWGFNPLNQFLASRGYMVVEPEIRGSTGYGSKLFKAGWKQWGLAMQDDVTDVTKWAIAQGTADPQRIAIAGASYGGYATMMGLLKEPQLYKAGINWVGVTDIDLLYSIGWSDTMNPDSPYVRFGMPRMIGDRTKDAAQLVATSPLQQAHRIKQPVLMAYGEEDVRVPLPHGTKMRDALIASGNKNVEWVQYEGEAHGWGLEKNDVDFYTRFERFLAKHLK